MIAPGKGVNMDRQQADLLVRELGQRLGLPELALDDGGAALIGIEGGPIVTIGYAVSTGTLELMTSLDKATLSPSVMRQALAANFAWTGTGGAAFAFDAISEALVLQRRCSMADAANGGLFAAMESLVAMAEGWSERLARSEAEQQEPSRTEIPAGMVRA
jgi:Tir chaperone protein (CesT) family